MPAPLLDVAALAAALDIHPETVRRLTQNGAIPVYRAGRAHRYDLDEVLAALRSGPTSRATAARPDFAALDSKAGAS